MTTKYIEIDSTYRNRNQFPLPSEFDVIISQSGLKGKSDAIDPVCDSAPILSFNNSFVTNSKTPKVSNFQVVYPGFSVIFPFPIPTTTSPTDPLTFLLSSTIQFRREENFYVGCTLVIDNGVDLEYRRIVAYEFVGSMLRDPLYVDRYWYGLFTVNQPFPGIIGPSGYIVNPSPLPTNYVNTDGKVLFWIPEGSFINNYYINYYLYNRVTAESNKIISYEGDIRLATLESFTATDWLDTTTVCSFCIRKELPVVVGRTTALTGDTNITSIVSDMVIYGTLSDKIDFYVGDYIRFDFGYDTIQPDEESLSPFGQMRRITAYDPATKTITFSSPIFVSAGSLNSSSGSPYPDSLKYEILPFSRDNFSPFNYTGSVVSSQQQDCYYVELRNLVIPNTLLKSGRGGRIAFYPYVYVEFHPISDSSTGSKGTLYSNNPNSYKMLFRAIVSDTQQPLYTAFAKISGDGQAHIIRIKPNDSFRFAVYNSDGELLQSVIQDNYSPVAPNPLVQISALFAFTRT